LFDPYVALFVVLYDSFIMKLIVLWQNIIIPQSLLIDGGALRFPKIFV